MAELLAAVIAAIKRAIGPLMLFLAYLAGQRAEAQKSTKEALEKERVVRDEYESLDHNRPDGAGTVERMQRGEY